jgi:hypothetical protein
VVAASRSAPPRGANSHQEFRRRGRGPCWRPRVTGEASGAAAMTNGERSGASMAPEAASFRGWVAGGPCSSLNASHKFHRGRRVRSGPVPSRTFTSNWAGGPGFGRGTVARLRRCDGRKGLPAVDDRDRGYEWQPQDPASCSRDRIRKRCMSGPRALRLDWSGGARRPPLPLSGEEQDASRGGQPDPVVRGGDAVRGRGRVRAPRRRPPVRGRPVGPSVGSGGAHRRRGVARPARA